MDRNGWKCDGGKSITEFTWILLGGMCLKSLVRPMQMIYAL